MTAPPVSTPSGSTGPIANAYTQALLEARATGYALGAEGIARLRRMFGQAIQDLTRELSLAGDDQITIARATALRAQIEATLALIERRIAEITRETAEATATAVVEIHKQANLALAAEYRPDLAGQLAQTFNAVNVRALATFAARGQVAATFRTLARRNVEAAAPALDNLLGSSIARGVSTRRLTKDVAALLVGGKPDLKTYGLQPSDVSGLRTLLYDARRIAVTETNNALREGNRQSLLASPIVKAVKWQVSGRHNAIPGLAPDECDELAEGNDPEDMAELGPLPPGYYSPRRFPLAPHPFCACVQGGPTIFYRPSEWGRILGKKPPEPTLTDFEVLVVRAIALFDEGKDRRIVFRALSTEFPGETRERIGQAVTEAELRIRRRPVVTDEEILAEGRAYIERLGHVPRPRDLTDHLVAAFPTVARARIDKAVAQLLEEAIGVTDATLTGRAIELYEAALGGRVPTRDTMAPLRSGVMQTLRFEFGFEPLERLALAIDAAEKILLERERSFEQWVERAIELLRENGFKFGATVVALVGEGASADLAGRATEEAMNRLANVEDSEVLARAKQLLTVGMDASEVRDRLIADFGIGPDRATRLTQQAYDELRAAVDYAEIEAEARRLFLLGNRSPDTLFAKMMERYPLANEERVLEIVNRVVAEAPPVDYSLVDLFVVTRIREGETRFGALLIAVMDRFPTADQDRVRTIISDRLAEGTTSAADLPPEVRAELEREADRLLRGGLDATAVITAIQQFAREMRAGNGFSLTGDEAAEIVLPVQARIAATITDDEVALLARAMLASGTSADRTIQALARSVLAGDTARARRIVEEITAEQRSRTSEAIQPGREQAADVRTKLAELKARNEAELARLAEERTVLHQQINAIDAAIQARPREPGRFRMSTPEEEAAFSAATKRIDELGQQQKAILGAQREAALKLVEVPAHAEGEFVFASRVDARRRQVWQDGIDVLRRLVPREVLDGFKTELHAGRGRAHYRTGWGAKLDKSDPFTVVVHELGHAIEYYRPEILKQSLAWRDARTAGESLQRLSRIYPGHGYKSSELTKPDQFFHAYVGKTYETRASEVLSMGLEEMARDPIGFANKDPDMFDFIFAVLRSAMNANPIKRGKVA